MDGGVEMQKPPLYYWLVASFARACAAGSMPGPCGYPRPWRPWPRC